MRNTKRSGTCLLKKGHTKRKPRRQCFSLLLSLCMAVSMFGGAAFSPALAQEVDPEVEQAKPKEEPQEEFWEQTREEIKARLLQHIKEQTLIQK